MNDLASEVLTLLTHHCPVATPPQLQRLVGQRQRGCNASAVLRAIKRLTAAGWTSTYRTMAHPLLELTKPLLRWSPGGVAPDHARMAWQLRRRWSQAPICTEVVLATTEARHTLGGACGGKRPSTGELSHHLHVTQVFLAYRTRSPQPQWQHEDELESLGWLRHQGRLPDAVVRGVAIDVGGKYSAAKLQELHCYYLSRELPYEIW